MNKTIFHFLLVLGSAGCLLGCAARQPMLAEQSRNQNAPAQTASPSPRASTVGFASREKLVEHYHKHGGEFGDLSMEEYLLTAQTLRDHALGPTIIESVRGDGVITRFDRDTGTFIAFNRDGVIRTCFRPNDGEAYFRRQAMRKD